MRSAGSVGALAVATHDSGVPLMFGSALRCCGSVPGLSGTASVGWAALRAHAPVYRPDDATGHRPIAVLSELVNRFDPALMTDAVWRPGRIRVVTMATATMPIAIFSNDDIGHPHFALYQVVNDSSGDGTFGSVRT